MSNIICFGCRQHITETICCKYRAIIPFNDWTECPPFLVIRKPPLSFAALEKFIGNIKFDLPPRFTEPK